MARSLGCSSGNWQAGQRASKDGRETASQLANDACRVRYPTVSPSGASAETCNGPERAQDGRQRRKSAEGDPQSPDRQRDRQRVTLGRVAPARGDGTGRSAPAPRSATYTAAPWNESLVGWSSKPECAKNVFTQGARNGYALRGLAMALVEDAGRAAGCKESKEVTEGDANKKPASKRAFLPFARATGSRRANWSSIGTLTLAASGSACQVVLARSRSVLTESTPLEGA